jgi:hypothetical protein
VSRATVRSAIVSYLQGANITGLSSVKPFPAKFTPEGEFYQGEDPGNEAGAIIWVHIEQARETRIALGGAHNGRKAVDYTVVLDCILRSGAPKSEDVGASNDAFLDSLEQAIRNDRQAGTAGNPIFQWGEGSLTGGPDIETVAGFPRTLNGSQTVTQVYSSVRLTVLEILND